ncbi:hypothetical protein Tco_0984125 [Tanacetum coccineum]
MRPDVSLTSRACPEGRVAWRQWWWRRWSGVVACEARCRGLRCVVVLVVLVLGGSVGVGGGVGECEVGCGGVPVDGVRGGDGVAEVVVAACGICGVGWRLQWLVRVVGGGRCELGVVSVRMVRWWLWWVVGGECIAVVVEVGVVSGDGGGGRWCAVAASGYGGGGDGCGCGGGLRWSEVVVRMRVSEGGGMAAVEVWVVRMVVSVVEGVGLVALVVVGWRLVDWRGGGRLNGVVVVVGGIVGGVAGVWLAASN